MIEKCYKVQNDMRRKYCTKIATLVKLKCSIPKSENEIICTQSYKFLLLGKGRKLERDMLQCVMADCVGLGRRTVIRDGVVWYGWGVFGLGDVIEQYGRVEVYLAWVV